MSWNIFVFFLAIIILFLPSIFDSTLAVQLLNTSSGIYIGQTVKYENVIVQRYLGIQYGNVNKRFDRATLIERENDQIMNATKFGPSCKPTEGSCETTSVLNQSTSQCSISYGIFSVKSSFIEQCLFLNVYMPVTPNNERKGKAIFIWIHGGSGQIGTGNIFDGTIFAAVGDIIVITFNFRLNLFGFLSSGDQRLEGNLGLYDQALVLDWIYKNGNALGGDIKRITVGGHSAGAPHSYYLAKSPLNKGRIRRLILQSGSPFNIWSHLKAREAMEKFDIVAHDNGCASTMTFDEKLKCLQDRDFDLIAEHEHHSYMSANHTNVVVTGNFMGEFREVFELNDTLANIDILMGSTDDEGVYVAVVPILMEQHNQEIVAVSHVNFTAVALKFLAAMQPDKACLHHQALEFDILFNNDYYRFMEERIKHSNRTYIYQYSHRTAQEHPSTCNEYLHEHNLVGHFAELEYTWGTPLLFDLNNFNHNITPLIKYVRYTSNSVVDTSISTFYSDEQIQFSKQLIEQWSNFIKYGQPKSSIVKDEWLSVSNMSTASIMHLKVNESKIQNLSIPSGIQFWRNQCSLKSENSTKIIQKNSVSSIHKISLIIFISSLLSHAVANLIDGSN
ncbi:unnamed protein product [Rotaria socialis]|uniref:Carboxylesterase type B domain-containing protein n=1 Tax=Rotaria socialis TaxID=392032 RepID=A0A820C5G4_9BILA|nr:unnamed protein product [Rotaria socialis]